MAAECRRKLARERLAHEGKLLRREMAAEGDVATAAVGVGNDHDQALPPRQIDGAEEVARGHNVEVLGKGISGDRSDYHHDTGG